MDTPPVILITWLNFRGISLDNFVWNFYYKILDVFFKLKHSIGHTLEMVCPIDMKRNVDRLDTGSTMWPRPLTSPVTLAFDFSCWDVEMPVSQGGLLGVKRTGSKSSELIIPDNDRDFGKAYCYNLNDCSQLRCIDFLHDKQAARGLRCQIKDRTYHWMGFAYYRTQGNCTGRNDTV